MLPAIMNGAAPFTGRAFVAPRWAEWGDIDGIIERALHEDLGAGDVTTRATVSPGHPATAELIAKESLVVAGIAIAARVFSRVDPELLIEVAEKEGQRVSARERLMRVYGRARSILTAERTALNLMQRACGIATMTRRFVDAAGGNMRVCDTRKTMPGLRALDRYAIRCGGGHNHRNDLGSGVLIKENHIRCAGGVQAAVTAARAHAAHTLRIECEVTTLEEAQAAVDAGAEALLLDNMDNDTIQEAVSRYKGKVLLEASGNMSLERLPALARIGVDLVSVGALTHSVKAGDISLLIQVDDRA